MSIFQENLNKLLIKTKQFLEQALKTEVNKRGFFSF
ncbi:MAG: hypothetical protein BACD_02133 [Bacteroides rodentium]